jgi:hypothetical protein
MLHKHRTGVANCAVWLLLQSDVWAGGVTLWEVVNKGRIPYSDPRTPNKVPPHRLVDAIIEGSAKLQLPTTSTLAKRLIAACLKFDHAKRPSPFDLLGLIPGGLNSIGKHGSPKMQAFLDRKRGGASERKEGKSSTSVEVVDYAAMQAGAGGTSAHGSGADILYTTYTVGSSGGDEKSAGSEGIEKAPLYL